MKTPLAALLLLAPLAALAVDAELPPPPVPDGKAGEIPAGEISTSSPTLVPEAKAMSAAYVPRYHSRDAWFIGFGVGTGDATVYGVNTFATLRDLTGPEPRVGALRFEVGLTLTDRLLLGLELTAVGTQQRVSGETARAGILNADAVLTFFPEADGLFFRLGGGASLLHLAAGGASDGYRGFNGVVGLGYAFWVGERFNLSLRFDHSRQRYQKGDGPHTSELWAGTIGFDWF